MTNAEARFNNSLRPRKPEGSLGRTAQDVHLDSHTAPELRTSGSVFGLFINGLTTAFLKAIGTVPDVRFRLTIFWNTGRRTSVNSRTSLVGASSTVAVVDFDSRMSFRIWSSERA